MISTTIQNYFETERRKRTQKFDLTVMPIALRVSGNDGPVNFDRTKSDAGSSVISKNFNIAVLVINNPPQLMIVTSTY